MNEPAQDQQTQDQRTLTLEQLDVLEEKLKRDPDNVLTFFREAVDGHLSLDQLRQMLKDSRDILRNEDRLPAALEDPTQFTAAASPLPEGFDFPGMDLGEIPIDPESWKFQGLRDGVRWTLHCGPAVVLSLAKAAFRQHKQYASEFAYQLTEPGDDQPLDIALFSDFGTGLYHSLYIAKQFKKNKFPYAIHCGDVYYSGRKSEFHNYMAKPLTPILDKTRLFMLNSNHEMYSGGEWYFDFLDRVREHNAIQQQEGSYFVLRSDRFQIVGIDTAYHKSGRFRDPSMRGWLEQQLTEGKNSSRTNILLSADHPYKYGEAGLTDLLTKDLADLAGSELIDLWFWGNTHYCALFDRGEDAHFVGSCIGHGGYPYKKVEEQRKCPTRTVFVEKSARFPAWTDLPQDRGNNGYCVMSLHYNGNISLRYVDWMSNERATAELTRVNGRLRIDRCVEYSIPGPSDD